MARKIPRSFLCNRPSARVGQHACAVRERVEVAELGEGVFRVVGIGKRRCVLTRPDPSIPDRKKVIASNVDFGVCVLLTRPPALKLGLVDRFLLACALGEVVDSLIVAISMSQTALSRRMLSQVSPIVRVISPA
jgi:putative ribosome biogenesis GTPase RsgA